MVEDPKAEVLRGGVDRSGEYRMWRCTACQRDFSTSYGLRMHRVREHGAPLKTVRRSKARP